MFSFLPLSPAVVGLFLPNGGADERSTFALSLALWAFWLAVWGRPLRGCVAATPLLLTTPVVNYLMLTYHQQLSPQVVGIVLETNIEESMQYLHGLWLFAILSYLSTIAVCGVALYLMRRYEVPWQPRWRIVALLGAPSIIGALHFVYQPLETVASWIEPATNPFRTTPWPLELDSARLSAPFGVILQIIDGVDAERKIAESARLNESFRFGSHQVIHSADRQVYVLVIGESARADRWSVNGYSRPTSPRLQQQSNFVSFSNVITVASWTRVSVPVIVTRKPALTALDPQFPERSLVSAFREAGFATYWMSTQAPLGKFDASFAVYANEADHVTYFNITGAFSESPPDGVMLEPLKRNLANSNESRQLIVIHTLGSHMEYRRRYPAGFDVFKSTTDRNHPSPLHDVAYAIQQNNAYDNSILYTDYFLSEVIAAVKASGRPLATVLYVSDHGEDLYDDGCEYTGHGRMTTTDLRVPLFFWYSDAFQQQFPEKVAALKSRTNEPLTTESIFPLMLDTATIEFPTEDPTRSVMSPSFAHSTRIVRSPNGGAIDFDHAHKNNQCELESPTALHGSPFR